MFMLIYKKSTSVVITYRCDESVSPVSAENWFSIYLKDNSISVSDASDLAYVEIEKIELIFDKNKYMWNESTQQVDLNPAYVAPTPTPPAQEVPA